MDHMTFVLGKDMTFFNQDAVDLLQKYNPVANFDTFLAN